LRRFPIIAIAALLAAGCGANTPTAAPSPAGSLPEPPSAPSSAPTHLRTFPAPSPTPHDGCESLAGRTWRPSADFSLRIPLGYENVDLDVTRIAAIADPDELVEFEPNEPYLDEPAPLVGGWNVSLIPNIDDDEPVDAPVSLVAATAVLRVDGRAPIRMDGVLATDEELEKPVAQFELPDVKGDVVIEFRVEWSDECYQYLAEGPAAFRMVRAAYAEHCPDGHKGVAAHWAEMQEPPVTVGGVAMPLVRSITYGKWTRYATFVDPVIGWMHWDPANGTATGPAGATLPVVMGNADLELETLRVEYYRRSAIVEALDTSHSNRGDVLFRASADPYPDGHFELLLPNRPGRYVASVHFDYETPCLSGDGAGGVAIEAT
jgi:hypothetical protein